MSDSDFTHFKTNFTGDLVTPTDPDYLVSIARWAANAQRRSKFVAFVRTPDDVALAIAFARANHLSVAIRGGGHNPAGASSIEGGLVIDLSRHLNQVRVDPEQKLAYVGGGALWETVDKEAIKHGLATVAGTVNNVSPIFVVCETCSDLGDRPVLEGWLCFVSFRYSLTVIIRLALGGGYGWLTGRYGLVIDNIVQVCSPPSRHAYISSFNPYRQPSSQHPVPSSPQARHLTQTSSSPSAAAAPTLAS